jgi:hypothetical protein
MLANQEELICMRINALNAVSSGLTWEEESRQLVQIYQDICVTLSQGKNRMRKNNL